ncbi:hypothetical protein [Ancylomarina longa]|uniref:Uncharacterized protein n=1 Tax=Ancylomarina longa TaxID=2487017 RepID=A0A434AXF4_9BACT|nr:hypothetical protein [Ancylomarina longa]RUT79209.1 hypothetical protein DLK05_05175 [Ancylomarina longa]
MILLLTKEAVALTPDWGSIVIPILLSGVLSFIAAFVLNQRELKKIKLQHQQQVDAMRKEKQEQLQLEIDKMQADAFCLLFEPLKYVSKNPDNPFAIFVVQKNNRDKSTFLHRTKGKDFLLALNTFLYSKNGELFLPRQLRNDLYHLRGLVHGMLDKTGKQDIIELINPDTVNSVNSLISGEENIHKQLRCLMGTEDRKPVARKL